MKTVTLNGHADKAAKAASHLEAMETKEPKSTSRIELPKLDIRTIQVRIEGDSELITHKWSEKAIKQMLDKQTGNPTAGKEPKNPVRDYQDAAYVIKKAPAGKPFEESTFGFPAIAFKNAAVEACTSLGKSITKVAARQAFHVIGELVVIEGSPRMREDMVKISRDTADIRYRPGFPQWACALQLRYNARVLTAEQIINMLNTAGFAVGVGEWRSERDGSFGLFHVA